MASAVTTNGPLANHKFLMFDFDPDGTDPVDVSWQDMRDLAWLMVGAMHSAGTGGVDGFDILANAESGGSGTDAEVKAHALASAPDAVGDTVYLQCLASELPPLGTNLRYVSASLELAVDTDEFVVAYVLGGPRFAYDGLTADVIA